MTTKTKTRRPGIQRESTTFDKQSRVDLEQGVVKNVKILGMESRHGYRYTSNALKGAVQLYEGIRVNIDHPDRKTPGAARSYYDRFGSLHNVHFVEGDGLRGDHHFNPKHPHASAYAWDAKNDPKACGFSHNAKGPLVEGRNGLVCESIEAVRSVDLVADAATTASLYEGKPRMKIKRKKEVQRRRLSPEGRNKVRRTLMKRFGREVAAELIEAMGGPDAAAPLAAAPVPSGGDDNVEALIALIRKVLANPNISAEESIKQVTKRLKALKDMIPGGSGGAAAGGPPADETGAGMEGIDEDDDDSDDDEDDDDTDAAPHKKKKGGNSRLESALSFIEGLQERQAISELCEELAFKPTAKQRKLLEGLDDDEAREALIESWQDDDDNPRRKPLGGRAKSKELQEGKGRDYKSSKDWVAGLKS